MTPVLLVFVFGATLAFWRFLFFERTYERTYVRTPCVKLMTTYWPGSGGSKTNVYDERCMEVII